MPIEPIKCSDRMARLREEKTRPGHGSRSPKHYENIQFYVTCHPRILHKLSIEHILEDDREIYRITSLPYIDDDDDETKISES